MGSSENTREMVQQIHSISNSLLEITNAQRDLLLMESAEYTAKPQETDVSTLLTTVCELAVNDDCARDKSITIRPEAETHSIVVDTTLVVRVLLNMVKNALEATPFGKEVRLWHAIEDGHHLFNVWNEEQLSEEIALRIFQHYFTTKSGQGRGLGTYSMKLIGERYLGGKVYFETSEKGTTFTLRLPFRSA